MVVRAVWPSLLAGFAMLGGTGPALAEGPDRPRLEQVWVDPVRDLAPDALAAARISNILFVHRCPGGCVITPGDNDARLNTSSIPRETRTLSEFNLGDEAFDQIIECVRDVYSPYDVQIVTEDPGEEFHHEAILAGTPQELG